MSAITGNDPKQFMSRHPDYWRDPSREGILRAALQEAVNHAKNREIPPDDIINVWELIIKDTR